MNDAQRMIRGIDAQIAELGVELLCLDVAGEEEWGRDGGCSFLGYCWPDSGGPSEKEKWIYTNWGELIQRFTLHGLQIHDLSGIVCVLLEDPSKGTRETRIQTITDWA